MRCNICNNDDFEYNSDISAKCKKCGILYNIQTKEMDYSNGGGQNIPSDKKSNLRIQNALQRFKIIMPHIINHNIFVDIGCGSGEMLEASKKYFDYHLGYDENKILINHNQSKGLNVLNKYFSKADISVVNRGGLC